MMSADAGCFLGTGTALSRCRRRRLYPPLRAVGIHRLGGGCQSRTTCWPAGFSGLKRLDLQPNIISAIISAILLYIINSLINQIVTNKYRSAKMRYSSTSAEPMLPPPADRELEDLAAAVIASSASLAGQLHPLVAANIGDLVRSMNCYYSNLIEGHDTNPRDIERALASEYSRDATKRQLQHEARAHIEVQRMIDSGEAPNRPVASVAYIRWLHHEFCSRLPDDLLWVTNPDTGERLRVVPGEVRKVTVKVGTSHSAAAKAARCVTPSVRGSLCLATTLHDPEDHRGGRVTSPAAVDPSLCRRQWPCGPIAFARHAARCRSRQQPLVRGPRPGAARRRYRSALIEADEPRRGDLDGRGALSLAALKSFCIFFLETCRDQIEFMRSLLQPAELLRRMKLHIDDEVDAGRLPKGTMGLLREALLSGEFERGKASDLTGYQERRARDTLSALLDRGLLSPTTPKGPVRLGFPIDVLERWFPRLYPGDLIEVKAQNPAEQRRG